MKPIPYQSEQDFDRAYTGYLDRLKQASCFEEWEELRSARAIEAEAINRAFAPMEELDRQRSAERLGELRELREKARAA